MIIRVHDPDDPRVAVFFHLTDAFLCQKQHPEKALFIAEGPKVVRTALECGLRPVSVLIRERHIDRAGELLSLCGDVPVYTGDDDTLAALTGFRLERSWILCAMERPQTRTMEEVCREAHRVAVLEDITEPSNVGAIFRSAAALGMDAVLLTPSCVDPWNRRSVRVCMGTLFRMPFARTPPDGGMRDLHELGFKTVCMALRDNSLELSDPRLKAEDRLAVYLGTEDTGLKEETIRQADYQVIIPMAKQVDSLNVAAAAAVAFWELRPNQPVLPSHR